MDDPDDRLHQQEEKTQTPSPPPPIPKSVWFVYLNVILVVIANIATQPVYIIYFNNQGWTTKIDVAFYSIVNFMTPLFAVLLNPIFGFWQGRRSSKELFLFDIVLTSYGYFTMALISDNRWVWLFGFILTRISISQNSVRMTYIIRTTSEDVR